MIDEHEESFQEEFHRDLIDAYISKMREIGSVFNRLNLKNIIYDLFFAGSDTASNTLNWGMLYMATHPQIQTKIQTELDNANGKLTWANRRKTPYTEAAIHEVQRCADIIPTSIIHMATQDVEIGGYFLPAGTQVACNIGSVLKDPKIFPDPESFKPDRFINAQGDFVADPHVIPFGLGKRRCLGEALAKVELYLFFTGILHKFRVEKRNEDILSLEPIIGVVNKPKPFKVRFVPRNS